jgi:hypothetical protein
LYKKTNLPRFESLLRLQTEKKRKGDIYHCLEWIFLQLLISSLKGDIEICIRNYLGVKPSLAGIAGFS